MKHNIVSGGILLYCIFILSSCLNLKKLNDYSAGSLKNIRKFEDLGYSFTKACNEKCEIEQLEKQVLSGTCVCTPEESADSVTLILYRAVKGYFDGLAKLSDNELTSYKFTGLGKALKEGDFGGTKINKSHVDAFAKIATILSRSVTDGYRKRKLSTYIGEANDAIKILLEALEFNLVSNLAKKLDIKKQRLESYYYDLMNQPGVSAYEKKKIIEEYNSQMNETGTRKKLIINFGKGLVTIANGHQKIFENRGKLNGREVLELITQYSSDLQDLVEEFNTIKNK